MKEAGAPQTAVFLWGSPSNLCPQERGTCCLLASCHTEETL